MTSQKKVTRGSGIFLHFFFLSSYRYLLCCRRNCRQGAITGSRSSSSIACSLQLLHCECSKMGGVHVMFFNAPNHSPLEKTCTHPRERSSRAGVLFRPVSNFCGRTKTCNAAHGLGKLVCRFSSCSLGRRCDPCSFLCKASVV